MYTPRLHRSHTIAAGELPYRLLIPAGYSAGAADTFPLLLFLHGAGQRGVDNERQLEWGGAEFAGPLQAAGPCFVVAPQCPPSRQWVNTPWFDGSYDADAVAISTRLTMALEIVEAVAAEFPIDRSRLLIMGMSMGGYGTWDAIIRRPELFAAAVAICGGGDPSKVDRIKNLPIWAFHGDADVSVPVTTTRQMIAALRAAGAADSTARYTEFAGVAHNSWTPAWQTPGLFEWLLSQRQRRS